MARYAGGGKNTVEGCRSIDVLEWRRKGYLQPPAPGKPPYAVTANCGGREQHIATAWTPCRFGGKRLWFQCGYCGRRVVRLYIVQAVFACRHCHRLGHASQLETSFGFRALCELSALPALAGILEGGRATPIGRPFQASGSGNSPAHLANDFPCQEDRLFRDDALN